MRRPDRPTTSLDDGIELDVRVFQRLLDPLYMAAAFADELLTRAQQIAHLLGWRVGNKAAPDQAMRHQI